MPDDHATEISLDADKEQTIKKSRKWLDGVKQEADELDIRQVLLTLWRRKYVIFGITTLITIIAVLVVFQLSPKYTASVQTMIDTRQNNVTDIQSVMSGISSDMSAVLSEVEVIQSRSLLERVVSKLRLDLDPEFNVMLQQQPAWKEYFQLETYIPLNWLINLGLKKPKVVLPAQEEKEIVTSNVVSAIQGSLGVSPIRRSLVIDISFISNDPRKSALIANTIADLYIVDQLESKFEATQRATSWLSDRLTTLKDKVETAERAVEAYRTSVADQVGQRTDMTTQQISELNTQVILSQTQRAEAKARLEQVERLLNAGGADLASSSEVLSSPLIQRLRSQEAEVIRKVSELESRYGVRHPSMIKAKNELRDLRLSIEGEVKKIAQSLRNEMRVASARETTLQQNLTRLEGRNAVQNKASIRLRELEREAQSNRVLYENFLNRFKETSSQDNLQQADARIISRADVPTLPTYPKKKLIVMVAFMGGLFASIVLVFLLERLQNTFRSTEDLEAETGISVLGIVPQVSNLLGRSSVAKMIVEKPTSSAAESIRNLQTSIRLSDVDNPPKIVSISSSTPSEGKSTVALWLAQLTAMSGKRVLLIDCDLRRPSVHRSLKLSNDLVTLVDVLANTAKMEEAIQKIPETGLYVIVAEDAGANAMDLLSSKHMSSLLKAVREHFDLIVLDAPPILAVADARVIGRLADKVVYVVKWNETPRGLVRSGLKVALEADIDLAGIVLTQVNTKKHASYGYHDYGYYYGKYKGYYSS